MKVDWFLPDGRVVRDDELLPAPPFDHQPLPFDHHPTPAERRAATNRPWEDSDG